MMPTRDVSPKSPAVPPMDHRHPPPSAIVYVLDPEKDLGDALAMLIESLGIAARAFASVIEWRRSARPQRGPACLLFNGHQPGAERLAEWERLAKSGIALPALLVLDHGDLPASWRARGPVEILMRPFDHHELLRAVQQCLARAAGNANLPPATGANPDRP